jgi:hypothetical protein
MRLLTFVMQRLGGIFTPHQFRISKLSPAREQAFTRLRYQHGSFFAFLSANVVWHSLLRSSPHPRHMSARPLAGTPEDAISLTPWLSVALKQGNRKEAVRWPNKRYRKRSDQRFYSVGSAVKLHRKAGLLLLSAKVDQTCFTAVFPRF